MRLPAAGGVRAGEREGALRPGARDAASVAADGSLPRLDGFEVLLVEDDADSRRMLQIVLETQGARVRACASAAEALEAAQARPADVVVSDIGMPGVDGYAFIRMLRDSEAHAGRPATPAIALTAYAQGSDRERALAAGFQRHVAKPVHPAELLAIVDGLRVRTPA